jgi:hypothetical protein
MLRRSPTPPKYRRPKSAGKSDHFCEPEHWSAPAYHIRLSGLLESPRRLFRTYSEATVCRQQRSHAEITQSLTVDVGDRSALASGGRLRHKGFWTAAIMVLVRLGAPVHPFKAFLEDSARKS